MFYWLLYFIPKNHLSYIVGKVTSMNLGAWAVRWFANRYNIDVSEAEKEFEEYKTINQLFTRKLKTGTRPIGGEWVHPVDAEIREHGWIEQGRLLQVKGKYYELSDLLADEEVASFQNGYFITYYLCPTDYHRIHSACRGEIYATHYIPGRLWPVNDWSVQNIKNLFSVNERMTSYIQTNFGKVASVKVGATNVGKISLDYDPQLISNQLLSNKNLVKKYEEKVYINAGDPLGCFHMGSTVVLLLEESIMKKNKFLFKKGKVKMGEAWNKE